MLKQKKYKSAKKQAEKDFEKELGKQTEKDFFQCWSQWNEKSGEDEKYINNLLARYNLA